MSRLFKLGLDSEVNEHMVSTADFLCNLRLLNESFKIKVANTRQILVFKKKFR